MQKVWDDMDGTLTEHVTHRAAFEALLEWLELKEAAALTEKRVKALGDVIRAYFAETGERALVDGETGRGAQLQARKSAAAYDLAWLRQKDQALFERLYELGCLQINVAAMRVQEKAQQVTGVTPYEIPGAITEALIEVRP